MDVSVTLIDDVITVEVADNGVGLGTPTRSSGLANLRKRAEQHNGTLTLDTTDDGGTRLTWTAHCGWARCRRTRAMCRRTGVARAVPYQHPRVRSPRPAECPHEQLRRRTASRSGTRPPHPCC